MSSRCPITNCLNIDPMQLELYFCGEVGRWWWRGGGSFDVIEATELKSGVFGSFILVALMPVGFVNCFF
jgi:hypothetical protein